MGRISNYTSDTTVEKTDKFLGSNFGGQTKNFSVFDVNTFLKNTDSSKLVYSFEGSSAQKASGKFLGTFSTAQKNFSALTSIKVSKYPSGSDNSVLEYLQSIVLNDIVLSDVKNINNFGVYTVNSITQDSSATDYYDLALTAKTSNGVLVDEQFYSIILYAGLSGDKAFTHTQSASSSSWTINHGLGKKPSVTITTLATGVQVIGEVTYTNNNTLVVSFAAAVSGIAHLN